MRIEPEIKLNYEDVLLKPKRSTLSSRRDVDMTREFKFRHSGETYKCCPIIASNMDGVGTFSMAKVLQNYKMMTTITKTTTLGEWQQAVGSGIKLKYLSVCSGTNKLWTDEAEDYNTMQKVLKSFPDVKFITIDVANGYHTNFSDFIARVRDEYPDKTIIAGNVVTAEMTEELIIRGADVVKVGIGPGSVCTTRTMAGVGVPQFSAVMECADAANGVGGHIVADGGCTMPGDLAKAFGAGAHFIMLGGMLAGHKECEGEVEGDTMTFYGMSSEEAQLKYYGGKKSHRASEGKKVQVPYKGNVADTIDEILGGLRSSCTYAGARTLKALPKCTTFVKVNRQLNEVFS